ncbi:MAG: hypothetical protein IPN29_02145 [Saprospiraceae bacterium]|nr:hypothetical protein [Saprospiraceae bacterium]
MKSFKDYLAAMRFLQPYSPFADTGFSQKMDDIMQMYVQSSIPETIVSDFIRTGMFFQIELICSQSASQLRDMMYGRYHAT